MSSDLAPDDRNIAVSSQAPLPVRSPWLGHIDPKSTYWYLSAVPELLALAAARLEPAGRDDRETS